MTVQDALTLSYYQRLGTLNEAHQVYLVQHKQSHRMFVEKHLTVYDRTVFEALKSHPIPNIPRIYELVEDEFQLIVIEEYIDGTSLSSILEQGTLPEAEAVRIVKALCEIVASLHGCNPPIIHRDIKPSNILLTEDGMVKLLDLNAAKPYAGAEDRDTRLIGTAGYAAPEQYGFGSSDVRTDIYAIGVLMAELVHGSFSRSRLTNWPYDSIAEKCTRLDPKLRYASVGEVRAALDGLDGKRTKHREGRYIRWLPPGFRALKPLYMVLMGIWYLFVAALCLTMEFENMTGTELTLNRVFIFLSFLLATLFVGNYLDVWERFGVTRIQSRALRILAVIGIASLIPIGMMIILVLIESFF